MKHLILGAVSALLLASCGKEEKQGNFELTGNVEGLNKGKLFVMRKVDTTFAVIDSIIIDGDSHFKTAFDLAEPEMLYLNLDRGQTNSIDNNLSFFAEPGKMNIDTKLETFYAKAKITGSENQKLYEEYRTVKSRFLGQQLDMTKKELEAMKSGGKLSEADIAQYKNILRRKYLFVVNFAINNKDHEIAPFVTLADIPDATTKYLDTIQKSMTPRIAKSKYGKMLTDYLEAVKKAEAQQPKDTAAIQ